MMEAVNLVYHNFIERSWTSKNEEVSLKVSKLNSEAVDCIMENLFNKKTCNIYAT